MEGWFATDADSISLQGWDQVGFFRTGCSDQCTCTRDVQVLWTSLAYEVG
uniref:Uncharacterized protein n=1 Tax=Arundo donax TaxID=35708 RepID=A0A0A9GAZ5_ARUDO